MGPNEVTLKNLAFFLMLLCLWPQKICTYHKKICIRIINKELYVVVSCRWYRLGYQQQYRSPNRMTPLLRWVGEGPYSSSQQKPLTISKNVVGKPQIWRVPNYETYLFPLTSSISSNAAKKGQNFRYLSNCPRIEGLRSLPWSKRYFEEKQYTLNERNGSFCQSMPQWVLGMVDAIYLPSQGNRPSNILIQLANLNNRNF